jgi:hypothetical protein
MNTQENIIAMHKDLLSLTQDKLMLAKTEQWEALIDFDSKIVALATLIYNKEVMISLEDTIYKEKVVIVEKIIKLNNEIKLIIENRMTNLLKLITSTKMEGKLLEAYNK